MICVTILSVMPGQISSAIRMLRSSSSMANRCSECSLCCCFNYRRSWTIRIIFENLFILFYFSSLLSGYHKTLQQKSAQKPKINGRITTYSLIPKTVSETKGWVYWCLGDLCIPTSVKTGEMTVVRLADLLIWSWTQGWRGQENKRLWESKLYWPPTSSYCIKKKKSNPVLARCN